MAVDTRTALNNLRGKYIKQLLTQLEKIMIIHPDVRKIILDNMNDLTRDILKELGYESISIELTTRSPADQ